MATEKTNWDKIEILFKILLPIALAYVGWISNQTAMEFDQQKYEHSVEEFRINTQLKYLDFFLNNLQYKDSIHQEIAIQLLPKIEPGLASYYSNILKKEIPKKESNKLTTITQSVELFGELNQYKIGIYYLSQNKNFAEQIKDSLIGEGFRGFVTLNLVEQDFFTKFGQPLTNEIRFEPLTEGDAANSLKNLLKKQYPSNNFETKSVNNRTPNFISIMLK